MADAEKTEERLMVTILDYGIGNVASVKNMLHHNGTAAETSSDPQRILESTHLLLPGVGAYDTAMARLRELNLVDVIRAFAESGKPLLGICLGAQLLMTSSEEGKLPGLNLIPGKCIRFSGIEPLRIPHMSWSDVSFTRKHPLVEFNDVLPRFYFVHSYHMVCDHPADILGEATYGYTFTCAVNRKNVSGVQFHPEKSHHYGATLLKNFAAL
jgi:glutamine amidotransferase